MTNPNHLMHSNPHYETDTPFALNERGRRIVGAAALAVITATGAIGYNTIANHYNNDPTETKPPTVNETILEAIHDGPDTGDVITYTLQQGDATSLVIEKSVSELEQIDNLGFLKGQQGATLISAQEINKTVRELTGGATQPNDKILTWRDDKTGYIVSSVDTSQLAAPPQN